MGALKLILAFAPWISLWLISWGHSLFRLQLGVVIAFVLVIIMALRGLHRGSILWGGLIFFSVALLEVVILKDFWFMKHMGVIAHGTLFFFTLIPLLAGKPFTMTYAKAEVSEEVWANPSFLKSCSISSGIWVTAFGLNCIFSITMLYYPLGELVQRSIELGIMLITVIISAKYTEILRARRKASAQ